jgi:hypothetical protein
MSPYPLKVGQEVMVRLDSPNEPGEWIEGEITEVLEPKHKILPHSIFKVRHGGGEGRYYEFEVLPILRATEGDFQRFRDKGLKQLELAIIGLLDKVGLPHWGKFPFASIKIDEKEHTLTLDKVYAVQSTYLERRSGSFVELMSWKIGYTKTVATISNELNTYRAASVLIKSLFVLEIESLEDIVCREQRHSDVWKD